MLNIPKEIKELFWQDSVKKNFRVHFPNGERDDITNSNIVYESVSLTESICSEQDLKFGLCEASALKFETWGIENIKGCVIEAGIEIDVSDLPENLIAEYGTVTEDVDYPYYRIPYGTFVVDECKRQSDANRRKAVAYSQLINNLTKLNPLEQLKQSVEVSTNTAYKADLMSFVVQNIKDFYKAKDGVIVAETALEMDAQKTYQIERWKPMSTAEDYYYLVATVATLTVGGSDSEMQNYYNKVVRFAYNKVDGFDDIVKDILERTPLNDAVKLSPLCLIKSRTVFDGHIALGISSAPYDPGYLYYPYMTGLADDEYIEIALPIKFEYFSSDNALLPQKKLCEWTVADGYEASLCEFSDAYYTQDITFERTKSKNGRYYCDINSVDLGSITNAFLELNGMFGKVARNGGMTFCPVKKILGLYPSEKTFPSADLYPGAGGDFALSRAHYISAQCDEEYTKPYYAITVTYVDEDNEECSESLQIIEDQEIRTLVSSDLEIRYDAENYQIYSLANNYLIRNGTFTAEEITAMLQRVAANIADVRYIPSDIELIGMPWVEAGDVVSIETEDGIISTIILCRTLTGVQALRDNFESR